MDWLHFVGKTYYTIDEYVREASKLGSSRKAATRVASQINWGDRIFLAQGDMRKKNRVNPTVGAQIFGYFTVTTLGGLREDTIDQIAEDLELEITNAPIRASGYIRRQCGTYSLGISLKKVGISIGEVIAYEQGVDDDGSDGSKSYLLQGPFTPISPLPFCPDLNFRWGFRRFDGELFMQTLVGMATDLVPIHGEFRRVPNESDRPRDDETGILRQILSYQQYDVYGPKHPLES